MDELHKLDEAQLAEELAKVKTVTDGSTEDELVRGIESLHAEYQILKARLKATRDSKEYGLVWIKDEEKHPTMRETVVEELRTKSPVLSELRDRAVAAGEDDSSTHLLIEGDNLHSLITLSYTHAGKIDLIYIDPPYNTGSSDFIYDDDYIDREDPFRHSKWLSFMEKRLRLARQLLSDFGTIFISIDDNEQAHLRLLCDKIFGEENVETLIWKKIGDGDAGAGKMKAVNRFRIEHEYILAVYKQKDRVFFGKLSEIPNFKNSYNNPDNDPRGNYKSGNISKTEDKSLPSGKNYYSVTSPSGRVFTRQWHFSVDEFNRLNEDNRIYWGKNGDSVPGIKIFIDEPREIVANSLLDGVGSATSASKALRLLFGDDRNPFPNPKPVELIKTLITLATKPDTATTVLDFFAGSGTTGQAVLELNKKDGGTRQFILCSTNDEREPIVDNVTYPRIKAVITGVRPDGTRYSSGVKANLRYFKIDLVEKSETLDTLRRDLSTKCVDLVRVKEGSYTTLVDKEMLKVFSGERLTAIILDPYETKPYIDEIDKLDTGEPINLYAFSYGKYTDIDITKNRRHKYEMRPIPDGILEAYNKVRIK